jgi:hypothetical protein
MSVAVAHEEDLRGFAALLLVEGLRPRTLQSLALIAEVVHGAPSRFLDPARFSFAHGGKDGHPFPVPLKTYNEFLAIIRRSLEAARIGDTKKLEGFRRLDQLTRTVEEEREPLAIAHERSRGSCALSEISRRRNSEAFPPPSRVKKPTVKVMGKESLPLSDDPVLFEQSSDHGLLHILLHEKGDGQLFAVAQERGGLYQLTDVVNRAEHLWNAPIDV